MTFVTLAQNALDYRPIIKEWFSGGSVVTQSHLIRWIETAEARQFCEAAMVGWTPQPNEAHHLHFGEVIAKASSWVSHGISREAFAAIGHHALACARHPLHRLYH